MESEQTHIGTLDSSSEIQIYIVEYLTEENITLKGYPYATLFFFLLLLVLPKFCESIAQIMFPMQSSTRSHANQDGATSFFPRINIDSGIRDPRDNQIGSGIAGEQSSEKIYC
jgi:hypothetical protein